MGLRVDLTRLIKLCHLSFLNFIRNGRVNTFPQNLLFNLRAIETRSIIQRGRQHPLFSHKFYLVTINGALPLKNLTQLVVGVVLIKGVSGQVFNLPEKSCCVTLGLYYHAKMEDLN